MATACQPVATLLAAQGVLISQLNVRGTHLDADKWRYIVTHPLVGHRVLQDMAGVGPAVATAVLLHHERLDEHNAERLLRDMAALHDPNV